MARARTLNYFEHLGGYVSEVCNLSLVNKVKVVPEFFHTAMSIKVSSPMQYERVWRYWAI